jgi:hypothetical protein
VAETAEPVPVVPAGPPVAGEGYAEQVPADSRPADELADVRTPVDNGGEEAAVVEPDADTRVTTPEDDRVTN